MAVLNIYRTANTITMLIFAITQVLTVFKLINADGHWTKYRGINGMGLPPPSPLNLNYRPIVFRCNMPSLHDVLEHMTVGVSDHRSPTYVTCCQSGPQLSVSASSVATKSTKLPVVVCIKTVAKKGYVLNKLIYGRLRREIAGGRVEIKIIIKKHRLNGEGDVLQENTGFTYIAFETF